LFYATFHADDPGQAVLGPPGRRRAVVHQAAAAPHGVLHLIYETPGAERADQVAATVSTALAGPGFTTTLATAASPSLICITARPSDEHEP
jgi:hypothetical protein